MNISEVQTACEFVRTKLEAIRYSNIVFDIISSLKNFPEGSCKTTSFILMSLFSSKYKVPKNQLFLLTSQFDEISHAWVKYNKLHIDLTGDQFGKERIIIASFSPWPQTNYQEHPFEEESWNDEYNEDINRVLQYLNP